MTVKLKMICLLILLAIGVRAGNLKLLSVNVIVLTGSSAPRDDLIGKNSDEIFGNVSYNSLLDSGKRQMYLLGKKFSKVFSDFLDSIQDKSKIKIRALNSLPGMMSAWAFSLGLVPDQYKLTNPYPTEMIKPRFAGKSPPKQKFTSPLPGAEPIKRVEFSDFEQTDYLFQLSSLYTCPNFNIRIVQKEINRLSDGFRFHDSYTKVCQYLKFNPDEVSFLKKTSKLYRSSRLFEYLEAMASVGKDTTFGRNTSEYNELRIAHEAYLTSIISNSETLNLLNSPISTLILAGMKYTKEKSATDIEIGKKFQVFVGHEKFMIGMLNFLGLYKPECAYKPYMDGTDSPSTCVEFPRPGASLVIEFYKEDFGTDVKPAFSKYMVNILYNGRKVGLGQKSLATNDEKGFIDWEHFLKFLEPKVVKNWEAECGLGEIGDLPSQSIRNWVILLVIFNLTVFLSLGCFMVCFKYVGKTSPGDDKSEKPENDKADTDHFSSDLRTRLATNN